MVPGSARTAPVAEATGVPPPKIAFRQVTKCFPTPSGESYLALGGGFALYLAWPFGGFNPSHMVLVFTFLVAWFLSLTLSSFKKYL